MAAVWIPSWRARLRWRLPAFREASLPRLLQPWPHAQERHPLPDALALAEALESNSPAAAALARWRQFVEAGQGKPAEWTGDSRPFPRLFLWLVQKGGEDVAAGFQKAAELYQVRASYRIEMMLYGALPVSILCWGRWSCGKPCPLMRSLIWMMNMLGSEMGGVELIAMERELCTTLPR